MPRLPTFAARASLLCCGLVMACGEDPTTPVPTSAPRTIEATANAASLSLAAEVGGRIFQDKNLSLNRNQSCASCHSSDWGFTSPNVTINAAGSVMFGSVPSRFGNRKPPSAAYATPAPVLFFDDVDETYVGGNFWDGRATGERLGSPSAEQSQAPFVNSVEQALPDQACVIYRISQANYVDRYIKAFGQTISQIQFPANTDALCGTENVTIPLSAQDRNRVGREYDKVAKAIAAFENSSAVNKFDSKHDAVLRGQATFTPLEAQGFALYVGKANCAACHPNQGGKALFTDYTYDNIGVPANPLNPALVANPGFQDLGIGGFRNEPEHYGKEKVPTLRNLDKRAVSSGAKSYMHNGVFKSLEQVVHFYNTRDVLPDCATVGSPDFGVNCWPAPEVTENVNHDELGNLGLTPEEETAVVAYLKTLSDGYSVAGSTLARK